MKYLYNTTWFDVAFINDTLAKYGLRFLTVYIPCRRITVTYGIPVHDFRVLKPWASLISEFYSLYPSFLFHSVLKILTVKANFQYLTLNLILSSLCRVESPGFEPGISACKAEVLTNYTMTPFINFKELSIKVIKSRTRTDDLQTLLWCSSTELPD